MGYDTIASLLRQCEGSAARLPQIVLENEMRLTGRAENEIYAELEARYAVMVQSAKKALDEPPPEQEHDGAAQAELDDVGGPRHAQERAHDGREPRDDVDVGGPEHDVEMREEKGVEADGRGRGRAVIAEPAGQAVDEHDAHEIEDYVAGLVDHELRPENEEEGIVKAV